MSAGDCCVLTPAIIALRMAARVSQLSHQSDVVKPSVFAVI